MKITTIPPGLSFVDSLAAYVLSVCDGDPLRLAQATLLLPNRRTCRSLRDAFLRRSQGRPLLLPRMRPVDEVDEDEISLTSPQPPDVLPAIDPFERRLLLTKLVLALGAGRGGVAPSVDQALQLAGELARFLDAVQIERLDFQHLPHLAPERYAAHWQVTVEFLTILTQLWPTILAERGVMDRQQRINRLLEAQTELWRHNPPAELVIAAGVTGSRPAAADLLAVVAQMPKGLIVLPGLDRQMDDPSWRALDQSHPQWAMKHLLQHLGVKRQQVRDLLPQPDERAARSLLLSEALRPAETCEAWGQLTPFPAATLEQVGLLLAPTPREEAAAIALMLRHALEIDGQTAALVTPDRALARRVTAELQRWGLGIDDSAGLPLDSSAEGGFLRLIATMVAEDFAPHPTLACLKHPLAAGGDSPALFRQRVEQMEKLVLRGPRPAGGLAVLQDLLPPEADDLRRWLHRLQDLCAPLSSLMHSDTTSLIQLLTAHVQLAEALASSDSQSGEERLWQGESGNALSTVLAQLAQAAKRTEAELPLFSGRRYPAMLDECLRGQVARRPWGAHPRLFLWGSLEARLQQADVMILAGLNEGTWPQTPAPDPWMSRPMRQEFGLPTSDWGIGQAAHDFSQAFAAPRVILSRSLRVDGAPTVPSRWLMRLSTVMQAAGLGFGVDTRPWLEWQNQWDQPSGSHSLPPPAPCPPVAARPRRLPVTDVEQWRRDPYGLYAKRILKLKALKPIDEDPGAAEYGTVIHACLEQMVRANPRQWPADAYEQLVQIGQAAFAPIQQTRPSLWAFWWPRYQSIVRWLVQHEAARDIQLVERWCEVPGELEISAPAGPFVVQARADRIDRLKDGTLAIIDYKTGQPPSQIEVAAGYSPQLPLEGVIARHGGFASIPAAEVSQLLFWRLKGGQEGGEEKSVGTDCAHHIAEALKGLAAMVAVFDCPETPYQARPHPSFAPKYSDYQHLARQKEWMSGDESDG